MGFLEALLGALEPVQHIASSSSSGLASSFGFVFQPPYQPGYKVIELPGNKLSLGPGRPYVLFLLLVLSAVPPAAPANTIYVCTDSACVLRPCKPARDCYRRYSTTALLMSQARRTSACWVALDLSEYITRCASQGRTKDAGGRHGASEDSEGQHHSGSIRPVQVRLPCKNTASKDVLQRHKHAISRGRCAEAHNPDQPWHSSGSGQSAALVQVCQPISWIPCTFADKGALQLMTDWVGADFQQATFKNLLEPTASLALTTHQRF